MAEQQTLKCCACKEDVPLSGFSKDNSRKASHRFGLDYTCRGCKAERRERQIKEHPDHVRKMKNDWAQNNREKCRESSKRYRSNNIEKERAKSHNRYLYLKKERPEKLREYHRNSRVNNPLKYAFGYYRKNAKSRGRYWGLSFEEFSLFQCECLYCGDEMGAVGIDRVDSSKGYIMGNVVPCCPTCNAMKTDHPQDYFINHCRKIAVNHGIPDPNECEP